MSYERTVYWANELVEDLLGFIEILSDTLRILLLKTLFLIYFLVACTLLIVGLILCIGVTALCETVKYTLQTLKAIPD